MRHLTERERPEGVSELVVLVGDDLGMRRALTARGFAVDVVDTETLQERYHVQAVPLLVVLDPLSRVRYAGGYTTRKQGPDIQDTRIVEELKNDRSIAALPLYGCAVSARLRKAVDPLGLSL